MIFLSNTSDHCPLIAEICCNLNNGRRNYSLYNWRKLSQKEISESYSVTLCNKLCDLNPPTSPANPLAIEEYISPQHLYCTPVKKPFLQSCSKSTKSQAGTLQSVPLIDGRKLLENGGNYLIIQATLLVQLENHT